MTFSFQKIVLGQTTEHFSTCSSLKIGLNLDQSKCWAQRRGSLINCNSEDSLFSNRRCIEKMTLTVAEKDEEESIDLIASGLYAGK